MTKNETFCSLCLEDYPKPKVSLDLCFSCFKKDHEKAIDLINEKQVEIEKLFKDIEKLKKQILDIKKDLDVEKNPNDILINYRYDVDLLNLELAHRRAQNEFDINQKSKKLSQEHYEAIKKINNWKE